MVELMQLLVYFSGLCLILMGLAWIADEIEKRLK